MRRLTPHLERGSALVTVLWVLIAMTGLALVLCKSMQVESMASANRISQAKVDMAEIGVEQYILAVLTSEELTPGYMDTVVGGWEQRKLGDCYFWVIKPNPDDDTQLAYGLTDEAGKIDLNTATLARLQLAPYLDSDPTLAANIVAWRSLPGSADATAATTAGAATDQVYTMQSPPYHLKAAPFESVEELQLVNGFTPQMIFDSDTNHNGIIDGNESQGNAAVSFQMATSGACGMFPYFTVYGVRATTPVAMTDATGATITLADVNATNTAALRTALQTYLPARVNLASQARPQNGYTSIWDWAIRGRLTSQELALIYPYITWNPAAAGGRQGGGGGGGTAAATTPVGKLNINTASKAALMTLTGLTDNDADLIINARSLRASTDDPTNIAWMLDVLQPTTKLTAIGSMITGKSTVYSADIVTLSHDGRAFKRVRIVVDAGMTPVQIIYRRDLTGLPFPLPPLIRENLRAGKDPSEGDTSAADRNNGLTHGIK